MSLAVIARGACLVALLALAGCGEDEAGGACGADLVLGDPRFGVPMVMSGEQVSVAMSVLAGTAGEGCGPRFKLDCGGRQVDVQSTHLAPEGTALGGQLRATCADDFQARNCFWEVEVRHPDGSTALQNGSTTLLCQP